MVWTWMGEHVAITILVTLVLASAGLMVIELIEPKE